MDAAQALADLTEVSTQIEGAVLADPKGKVLASTYPADAAERVAAAALGILNAADGIRDGAELTHLSAETDSGAVFVVRSGAHVLAAVTKPEPIAGLIFYDLKTSLRMLEEKPEKRPSGGPKKTTAKAEAKADDGA